MEILTFPQLEEGLFLRRPNRFLAEVETEEGRKLAHVHDPGRLSELLVPGARILLLPKRGRRTEYHVIAAWREGYGWVFAHSGYHSTIAQRLIEARALPEFRDVFAYGKELKIDNHRIDFVLLYPAGSVLMEVKGCTLFQEDLALFPDAPTKRGREHVNILAKYRDSILLLLVMSNKPRYFTTNAETDPRFHRSFLNALSEGMHVIPATFSFDGEALRYNGRIPFISNPHDSELRSLVDAAAETVQMYNERFGPEAQSALSGVYSVDSVTYISSVFYGVFCQSCGLYDYFDDYKLLLESVGVSAVPESVKQFGNTFVVRFRVK